MNVKDRIEALSQKLLAYQKAYYVDGQSLVSDTEYDGLFDELVRLEAENPEYAYPDSPTKRVGSDLSSEFPEVKHTIPVLSLDKAYSEEEILSFFNKSIVKEGEKLSFVAEEKIDGISMVLYYVDGILDRAVTRGNGEVGNDVTDNIKTIHAVPLKLPEPLNLAVRGEVYIAKADFLRVQEQRKQEWLECRKEMQKSGKKVKEEDSYVEVANPRNLAAGSVKLQKSSEASRVPMTIFCYEGFFSDEDQPQDHLAILKKLNDLGFRTNSHLGYFAPTRELAEKRLKEAGLEGTGYAFSEIEDYIKAKTAERPTLPYEIDGLVFKIDELDVREHFGYTEHHPRWAIAYKFESPQANTKVLGITIQVGRTGRITPVAELVPVKVGGSTVARATLHNQEYIDELELAIGDEVAISKRGDVIPAVEEVIDKNTEGNTTYKIADTCPTCGTKLEKVGAHLFCPNHNCPDQVLGRLSFFVGRDQMDIETLGPKTIEKLIAMHLVFDIPDLYTCDYNSLAMEKGFGDQSVINIKESLEESKKKPFAVVLTSLGIPDLGKKAVELLIKSGFKSVDSLIEAASKNDETLFTSIPQIGPQTAQVIIDAFQNPHILSDIERLRALGLNFEAEESVNTEPQIFLGQVWCATGSFENFNPRTKALEEVEKRGGRTVSSVTSKTTHLLCGKGGGSKRATAEKLGVTIVTEEEFLTLLGKKSEEKVEYEQGLLF